MKFTRFILLTLYLFSLVSCGKKKIDSYEIIWRDYEGKKIKTEYVLEGTIPKYDGPEPTKPSTDKATYTFNGWNPEPGPISGPTDYYAQFSEKINTYTVTWKNYDGTILDTKTVSYGESATYSKDTPTREPGVIDNKYYSYIFSRWSADTTNVKKDIEAVAIFTAFIMTLDEKQVFDYLVENGVPKNRYLFTGGGYLGFEYDYDSYHRYIYLKFIIYGNYTATIDSSYEMTTTYRCAFGAEKLSGYYELKKEGLLIYKCQVDVKIQNHLYKSAEITEVTTEQCSDSEKTKINSWIANTAKVSIESVSNYLADHNLPYIY